MTLYDTPILHQEKIKKNDSVYKHVIKTLLIT